MAIHKNDMLELQRISCNTYAEDKACINRVIKGIKDYERVINTLNAEMAGLKLELAESKANK